MDTVAADRPHHVSDFQHADRTAKAVQADVLDFRSWAVLLQHSSSSSSSRPDYFCLSCSDTHACEHILAGGVSDGSSAHMTLSADAFEKKLKKDFDVDQGESCCCTALPFWRTLNVKIAVDERHCCRHQETARPVISPAA